VFVYESNLAEFLIIYENDHEILLNKKELLRINEILKMNETLKINETLKLGEKYD
jgi:hypothetical protein